MPAPDPSGTTRHPLQPEDLDVHAPGVMGQGRGVGPVDPGGGQDRLLQRADLGDLERIGRWWTLPLNSLPPREAE